MNKNNMLPIMLILSVLALGAYFVFNRPKPPQVPAGYDTQVVLPNGQPAWVNTAGVAVNAAGTILGSISDVINAIKAGQGVKGIGACRCGMGYSRSLGFMVL